MPHLLQVGQTYAPGKSSLAGFQQYSFRGGAHELLLVMDGLTHNEIAAVKTGECEFGLVVYERIVFFLYRFEGGFKWSDAPFSVWMLPAAERVAPEPLATADTRAILQIVLVDADKNVTKAFRVVSLSQEFTGKLHAAITDQLAAQIPIKVYEQAVVDAYSKWSESQDMLQSAIARCKGGA